jgi:hypothetical protein
MIFQTKRKKKQQFALSINGLSNHAIGFVIGDFRLFDIPSRSWSQPKSKNSMSPISKLRASFESSFNCGFYYIASCSFVSSNLAAEVTL